MTLHMMILLALKASIVLSVFAIGLDSAPSDVVYLLRRPGKLARSLLAMDVVMPVLAASIVAAFDLNTAVEVALVALAVSPAPPILPRKQIKAKGEPSYAIALLLLAAAVAVIFVPVAVELLGHFFQMQAHMQPWPIAALVLMTVFAPLTAGILVRRFLPAIALRISRPAAHVGAATLLLCFAPVVFTAWPAIVALIGNGTVAAIAAFLIAGLLVGHVLGGPDSQDRTVLALATATRHPGVALAIATTNFPQQKAVLPAILLYLILGVLITIPYVMWRKRVAARGE